MSLTHAIQHLVRSLPEATLILTPAGEVVAANPPAGSLLRRPAEELVGRTLEQLVAEDPTRVRQFMVRWLRTQSMVPGVLTFQHDGRPPVPCRCDAAAIAAGGAADQRLVLLRLRPRQVAVTGFRRLNAQIDLLRREIEERKLAELALRESEERRLMALHATGVGSWSWDRDRDQVIADLTVLQLFGVEEQRPIDQLGQLVEQLADESRPALMDTLQAALMDNSTHFVQSRVLLPEGGVRWLATQVKALRSAEAPRRLVAVTIDVTSQRASEEQQQEVRRLESIGRLAGGVAHEANNQMTVVLGCTDFVLRRTDLPSMVREDIEQVRRAAMRTSGITSQLLAYSRRQVLRTRPLDLNRLVSSLLPALERALENRGSLHLHLAPRIRQVMADADQLEQVLLNLVFNARDAIGPGGHVLLATQDVAVAQRYSPPSSREVIAPGAYMMIAVSDNGTGMTPATVERIFEPFFTTKDVGKGTGLGLAMVQGIIKQLGGHIWADSRPGEGTTFRILLPVVEEPGEAPVPVRAASFPTTEEVEGRVLVVDDDDAVREIVSRVLRAEGFGVVDASGGKRALEILASGTTVDLVLTDLIMPEMRGEELGRRIEELYPAVPLLYMSGLYDRTALSEGSGEVTVLRKPVPPDALVNAVRGALGKPGN